MLLLKPALQRAGRLRGRKEEPEELSWRRNMGWFSPEVEETSFTFRLGRLYITLNYYQRTLWTF